MTTTDNKSFGVEFRNLRKSIGLSQVDLGNMLEISRNTIKDWELEKRVPPLYVQRLLLKELNRLQKKIKKS